MILLLSLNYILIIFLQRILPKLVGKINEIVRNILFFFPYLLPFIYIHDLSYSKLEMPNYIVFIAVIMCLMCIAINFWNNKTLFNFELLNYFPRKTKTNLIFILYELIGSSVFEEIFYRQYVFNVSNTYLNAYYSIFITSTLFILTHLLNRRFLKQNSFSTLVILSIFSISLTLLYLVYNNILLNIFVHLCFNSPLILLNTLTTDWKNKNVQHNRKRN